MLERLERKKQRHDQNQRDREKPPREAGAQSHLNFWSGDKRVKLSPLTGGRNGNAMIVSRHMTPNRNPFVTWEHFLGLGDRDARRRGRLACALAYAFTLPPPTIHSAPLVGPLTA